MSARRFLSCVLAIRVMGDRGRISMQAQAKAQEALCGVGWVEIGAGVELDLIFVASACAADLI